MIDDPACRNFEGRLYFDFACIDILECFVTDELGYFGGKFAKFLVTGFDVANQRQLVLYTGVIDLDMHMALLRCYGFSGSPQIAYSLPIGSTK